MRHSLHAHIAYLETTIQNLRERLTRPRLTIEQVEDIQLQLTLAESALEHYRQAYALELSVSSSEPPNPSGASDSNGGSGNSEAFKPKSKKDGLASHDLRVGERRARTGRISPKAFRSRSTRQQSSFPTNLGRKSGKLSA